MCTISLKRVHALACVSACLSECVRVCKVRKGKINEQNDENVREVKGQDVHLCVCVCARVRACVCVYVCANVAVKQKQSVM